MNACCNSASTPQEFLVVPKLPLRDPSSARSFGSPTPTFGSAPLSPLRDLRDLLMDLGQRQEEHFKKVEGQQQELYKELHKELLALQLTSRANATAQSALQRCQENFLSEVREFVPKFQNSTTGDMTMKPAGTAEMAIKQSPPVKEFTGNASLNGSTESAATEPAKVVLGKAQPSTTPNSPMLSQPGGSPDTRESHFPHALNLHATSLNAAGRTGCWLRAHRILKSKEFELAIAMAIISNAFLMCVESQYHGLDVGFNLQYPGREVQAKLVWPGAELAFHSLDWFFGLLFVVEMLAKFVVWRCGYFYEIKRKGRKRYGWRRLKGIQGWNWLDFCCVAAFLFDKMASISAVNPQMLRLLRLFRLFRLVRLLRWLESLDHLYVMATAIAGLSKVLTWAIVLLTIMLLICNLFLVQILQATYFNRAVASDFNEEALHRHHQMYEYFGTCTRCMLSMFEITLSDWPPVARLLTEEVSQWFTLFCVLHKLTIGFSVIGVITGIILQETFKVVQTDDIIMFRQKKQASCILRKKMQALFDTLDEQRDGKLNMSEFTAIGDDPEIQIWLSSLDMETDDLPTLFSLIDEDDSGYITVEELVARMPRIMGGARGIDMLAMMQNLDIMKQSIR